MGPTDLIENGVNGFLTPLKLDEFNAKIEKLLDDKVLYKEFVKGGKLKAAEVSGANCAIKMEQLYEKTISYRPK